MGCGLASAEASTESWSPPAALAGNVQSFGYQVKTADTGEAVAAWSAGGGIFAAAAPPGLPFGPAYRLSSQSGDELLAVDREADTAIVWRGTDARGRFDGNLLMTYRGGGGPFLPGRRILRRVGAVAIGMDAAGDVTLVWQTRTRTGRTSGLAAAVRGANGSLGRVQQLVRGSGVWLPVVAVNSRGDAIAAWQSGDSGPNSAIYAATRRAGHRFGAPFMVVPADVGGLAPNVGIDDRGGAVVAWDGPFDGASQGLPFKTVQVGFVRVGRPGISRVIGLRRLPRKELYEGVPQPQIAVDRRGHVAVAWDLEPAIGSGRDLVEVARGEVGKGFSTTSTVGRAELDGPAQLAISPSGTVLVGWDDLAGPDQVIIASPNARFGLRHQLSASGRLATTPALAVNDHRAVAIWQDLGPTQDQTGPETTPLLFSFGSG